MNDICFALKVLAEKDSLPMFLATSEMIKETSRILKSYPADNGKEVKSRLKEIEKSINSILDQNNGNTCTSALTTKDVSDGDGIADYQACAESSTQQFSKDITWVGDDDIDLSISNSPSENENKEENDWVKVPKKSKRNGDKKTWKKRLNILRGTAAGDNEAPLSADVHLVAYGLSKGTTGVQLSQWLNRNSLLVRSCDFLTKFEGARSLTYIIVVKASEYDKAINPDIWPARVDVRKYNFFGGQNNTNGISRSKSQRYDSQAHVNSDSGMSLKPILRNSNGNIFARQFLQTVPSNLWLPANSLNYQNMYGLDENSPANRLNYQNMYGLDENSPANRLNYQNMYGLDENSPVNRKGFQNRVNAPVNGSLNQRIYQPRYVNHSNVDLSPNTTLQSNGANDSFGYQNNYQASNGNSPAFRFSENLGMDYYV